MFGLEMGTILVLAVVGVLLYGERLPEVGKSLGKSYMDFKRGLNKIQQEFHSAINLNDEPQPKKKAISYHPIDDGDEPIAPKFEPPPAEPKG